MRYLYLLLFTLNYFGAHAAGFHFPQLAARMSAGRIIAPPGWKAMDTVAGDLNRDGRSDLVLVFEHAEPISETRAYGDADTELVREFQKPRILAVYFRTAAGYSLALQNNNFILREHEGGIYGDPYEGITVSEQVLSFQFTGGSNWRWKLSYDFRYEQGKWLLIRARNKYYHHASGEVDDKEYDFRAGRVTERSGTLNLPANDQTVIKQLAPGPLRTFDTFKKPWTWEIRKDEFL